MSAGMVDSAGMSAPYRHALRHAPPSVRASLIVMRKGDILPRISAASPAGHHAVQCAMIPRFRDIMIITPTPIKPKAATETAAAGGGTL